MACYSTKTTSYSSRVPDRYIDFAKIGEGKIIDIVKAERYTELEKKMEEQRIQNLSLKEEMQEMRKTMEALSNEQKLSFVKMCGEVEFRLIEGSDEFIQLQALLAHLVSEK